MPARKQTHSSFGESEPCVRAPDISRVIDFKMTIYYLQGSKWQVWNFLQWTGIYATQQNVQPRTEKYFNWNKNSIDVFNSILVSSKN